MIVVSGVSFGYRSHDDVFRRFDWTAAESGVWAILGPSGCGKTTLLHLLAGLRRPSAGTILADGEKVDGPRRSTGLILQDLGLLPWATVWDNVALGLRIRGVRGPGRSQQVSWWLERLGLAGLRHQYPSQISGGQRQRVAIARTLVLDPDLLLMDEPFAALDAFTREDMQDLLVDLARPVGGRMTTVLVTHDVAEAVFLGRRILVLPGQPIEAALTIDNELAGSPGYRLSPEYHEKCLEVRAAVRRARGNHGAEQGLPGPGMRR